MENSLLNTPEAPVPNTLKKLAMFLLVVIIIFQGIVMAFVFGSNYSTGDTYEEDVTKLMNSSIQDVEEGLQSTGETVPRAFCTPYQLPRYCQQERGTCWAFSTIGILEQSYRENGIKKGFLKEEQYVRLSPQGYAIDVMNECAKHRDACPSKVGRFNSTAGGFVEWLYAFPSLYDKILPEAACPYQYHDDGEWICDRKDEKQSKNPIKFDVTNLVVKRSINEVKKLLVKTNKPVAFDSSLIIGYHVIPTKGHEALRNLVDKVDGCPDDASQECMYLEQHEMNPNGEFFIADTLAASEGGHAMNIVGYNDEFANKDGSKGAFVVRNSWLEAVYDTEENMWKFPEDSINKAFIKKSKKDKKRVTLKSKQDLPPTPRNYYRGSHSSDYILGKISEWDERTICPNANNVMNWDSCVSMSTGPTKYGVKKAIEDSSACFNETFMMSHVKNYRRPMEFRCLNQFSDALCNDEDVENATFFLTHKSQSLNDPNLINICMLRVMKNDHTNQKEFCVRDVPFDYIEFLFMPVQKQMDLLQNNEDYCGFHIWPYSYIEKNQKYRGFFDVLHFDIEWDDRSYAANKENNKDFDYSLIEESTGIQSKHPEFAGPEPYQTRFQE